MEQAYTIIADLHTHTLASTHAYSSLTEMVRAASERGLYAIAITDHGKAMPGSPRDWYFGNLREVPLRYRGVLTLAGMEANVLDFEGRLDLEPGDARALDWVKENIHRFGGDADNITLCGFSDGGRMAAALAGSPLFRERFQKAVAISGGLSLADPDAAAQKLAENFAPLAVEDGRFADTASAAEWLLTPGADVREWLCGLEPARIAALGKPAILYADDVVLSRDARSAVPLLLLSSASEFSGFVRDDLRPASSAARAYAVKYGSALCRWSSTEAVAEALGGSAPVWLGLIDYGGADSQTTIPGLGSFHGLPLALFSSESSYSACADLSSAGAQALSVQLKQALAGFMTSGSPGWDVWTPQDRDALHFDADSETVCITLNSYPDTQESIRAAMAADTSLSAAEKETVEHLYFSGFSF